MLAYRTPRRPPYALRRGADSFKRVLDSPLTIASTTAASVLARSRNQHSAPLAATHGIEEAAIHRDRCHAEQSYGVGDRAVPSPRSSTGRRRGSESEPELDLHLLQE